jgi:hypothetical protein
MGYREVRVYDGDFPTHEQILTGDPASPPFPKQIWREQIRPGEFAVRYKDFKTGLARNSEGKHVRSSEISRIFGNLEEARANSRAIAAAYWTVVCVIYDQHGAETERISNHKELNKYAVRLYAGMLLWTAAYTCAGMAALWMVYRLALFPVRGLFPGYQPIRTLTWMGWLAFTGAGLALAIAGLFLRLRMVAANRVKKVQSSITAEEMKRFEEVNSLYGTADPVERERFLQLFREIQERVQETLKK